MANLHKCLDCPTMILLTRKRCPKCADIAEIAKNQARNVARSEQRVCPCGCGKKPEKYKKYATGCLVPIRKKSKRVRNHNQAKSFCKPEHLKKQKPAKKKELSDAEIDRRAIAIDKENRRIEAELAERAARLPSHLIAARMMRDVCVSVLY